jgi:hypothetical protein
MNTVPKDVKIAAMLRRAVRVGYLGVYPGLDQAAKEYFSFCEETDRPYITVNFKQEIIIEAIHYFGKSSQDQWDSIAEYMRQFHSDMEVDSCALWLRNVPPLQADRLAAELYTVMCVVIREKRAQLTRDLYPNAQCTDPQHN